MNDKLEIQPVQVLNASIRPPGSKSITNRALVCAAMADGPSTLTGALDGEDTQVMIDSLVRLGIDVRFDAQRETIWLKGSGGRLANSGVSAIPRDPWAAPLSPRQAEPSSQQSLQPQATGASAGLLQLFVGNSGTTIRFLVAMLAACRGRFRLDGVERMRQRPIGDLLAALNGLGADVRSEGGNGCPPVLVNGQGLGGGCVSIRGDISSQFLSGLLMAAPYAASAVDILVAGELVSQPYVQMTLGVMSSFGVRVQPEKLNHIHVGAPQMYRGCEYSIEPDASAASYFWGAAAVTGGSVAVEGLSRDALQGDVQFCECLRQMGCDVRYEADRIVVTGDRLHGIEVNMNGISDTVQTLAAVALFAQGSTTISGVGHIRHKETDRIGDLARELRKLGAKVDEFSDGLRITPGDINGAEVQTYKDHRMAMSLSLVGLRVPHVVIVDPGCTAKTYPNFFVDLERVCRG